jgi:predicted ATP-grasp superfamily ATP-dependent carboligase
VTGAPRPGRILVVAVSARMLAQLAVADGYEVVGLDRFGDVDLRAVAATETAAGNDALVALADEINADAVVYGAGLENRPDLVARLADGRELLGTPAERLPAVRDPWAVAAAAVAAGARAPETLGRSEAPVRADGWLRKPRAGGGGRGVRRWAGGRLRDNEILQRHVAGMSCSAVAIGDGRDAVVLGLTEQLHRGSYEWTGNVTPPRLPAAELAELDGRMRAVCAEAASRFGVRGAFGVDGIWDGYELWVLEVNPRPTASLELFEARAFAAHVRGARGVSLLTSATTAPPRCAKVKLVLFADRDLRAPEPDWWPAGLVRDIPHAGELIRRGSPVCTLVSATADPTRLATWGAALLATLTEPTAAARA